MIGIARLTAARIACAGNVAPARPAVASPLLYLTGGLFLRLMMFGKPADGDLEPLTIVPTAKFMARAA